MCQPGSPAGYEVGERGYARRMNASLTREKAEQRRSVVAASRVGVIVALTLFARGAARARTLGAISEVGHAWTVNDDEVTDASR